MNLRLGSRKRPRAKQLRRLRRRVTKRLRSLTPRARARAERRRRFAWVGAGAGAGALVVYLLDPQRGKARRHQLRDRSTAVARQAGRRVARAGRYAGATAVGLSRRLRHSRSGQPYAAPNDQTLAAKVESEVFRRVQVPKGSININVEEGVVVLRGEVGDAKQIAALEKAVNAVDGVRGVDNLLHLPGQPAPNKVEAQRVGFPT